MVIFEDKESAERYVFLIQKGQQPQAQEELQLQTPGGKVSVADAPLSDEELAEEKTYLRAAMREACEEICGDPHSDSYKNFEALLKEKEPIYIVNAVERNNLNLRPENGPYDTRTICFYLGKQELGKMRAFLKMPDANGKDTIAAYIAPCDAIVREKNDSLRVEGREKPCTLSNISIRPTTITILRDGALPKIKQEFPFSESYSCGSSPTHFQPAEEGTLAQGQERYTVTPKF